MVAQGVTDSRWKHGLHRCTLGWDGGTACKPTSQEAGAQDHKTRSLHPASATEQGRDQRGFFEAGSQYAALAPLSLSAGWN